MTYTVSHKNQPHPPVRYHIHAPLVFSLIKNESMGIIDLWLGRDYHHHPPPTTITIIIINTAHHNTCMCCASIIMSCYMYTSSPSSPWWRWTTTTTTTTQCVHSSVYVTTTIPFTPIIYRTHIWWQHIMSCICHRRLEILGTRAWRRSDNGQMGILGTRHTQKYYFLRKFSETPIYVSRWNPLVERIILVYWFVYLSLWWVPRSNQVLLSNPQSRNMG